MVIPSRTIYALISFLVSINAPFSRKVVISRKIENSRQFDENPNSLLKLLMLSYFLLVYLNLGG